MVNKVFESINPPIRKMDNPVKTAISGLETLLKKKELQMPTFYDEKSKDSFISAVRGWGNLRETPITERKAGLTEIYSLGLADIRDTFVEYSDVAAEEGSVAWTYNLVSIFCGLFISPALGLWQYDMNTRTVLIGNELQRKILFHQTDPVIHEYMHAYEHLVCDTLFEAIPECRKPKYSPFIVEPPIIGFQFNPPSYKKMKKFENSIIGWLINYQQKSA